MVIDDEMLGIVDDIDMEAESEKKDASPSATPPPQQMRDDVVSEQEMMSIHIDNEELANLMDFMTTESKPATRRATKMETVAEHVKEDTEIINADAAVPRTRPMVVSEDDDIKDESEDEMISDDLLQHAVQMSADFDTDPEEEDEEEEDVQNKTAAKPAASKHKGDESMDFEIDEDMMDNVLDTAFLGDDHEQVEKVSADWNSTEL